MVDSARNAYVSGQNAGKFATTTSVGGYDAFLMKFDKDGVQQWALQMGTSSADGSFGLSIDANDNVYPLIKTEGSMEGSNLGLADIVLMQVDSTGTILSTDQFGTAGTEYLPSGGAVAVDSAGDVFITGATNGAFTNYTNAGSYDLFVYKIDAKTTTTSSSSRTFTTSSSVTATATTSSTATLSTTSTVSSSSTGSRTSTSTYSRNLAAVVNCE